MPSDADAFVVGSGPHGASGRRDARRRGLKVLVIEGAATSGGPQNEELTLPGIWHDVGSAAHPLAVASPPLRRFSLGARGPVRIPGGGVRAPVGWGPSRLVTRSVAGMAGRSAVTRGSYRRLMQPLVAGGTAVTDLLLYVPTLSASPGVSRPPLAGRASAFPQRRYHCCYQP